MRTVMAMVTRRGVARTMGRLPVAFALTVGIAAVAASSPSVALASCDQSVDIGIFKQEGASPGTLDQEGTRTDLLVNAVPVGQCGGGGLVGGGAAHMHVGGAGSMDYAEIGYVTKVIGATPFDELFWEEESQRSG